MNNKKLQALAAAALALPGLAATAEEDDAFEFGYRFHHYSEDPLSAAQTGMTERNRYEIRANQFNLSYEPDEDISLNLAYQHENMAGASPWFTLKDDSGKVTQVMSGASIVDSREDVQLSGSFKSGSKQYSLTVATSDEDDYESLSFGAGFTMDFNNKLSTLSISADVSNDDLFPADSALYNYRIVSAGKRSTSMLLGYSRVINKYSIFQIALGYTDKSGYLSDPYKQVFVDFDLLNDTRPASRSSKTLSFRYRHYFDSTDGALHGDYRYYDDSWDISSHTWELSYHQPIGWDVTLIPSIRLYQQDSAYFYQHFYDTARTDGFHSTDYRLSAYGAETYALTIKKVFEDFNFHLKAQKYGSGGSRGFADYQDGNPALLDFVLFSAGFDFKF